METVLLVDGENFKGKVEDMFKELKEGKPEWRTYGFKNLFDKVLDGISMDRKIFYFARIKEHPDTAVKSR